LLNIAKKVGERQWHTVRGVHAKSHGLLKAEAVVPPGLHASQRLLQPRFIQPSQQLDSENTGEWRASFAGTSFVPATAVAANACYFALARLPQPSPANLLCMLRVLS